MPTCFKCKKLQAAVPSRDGATKPYCGSCFLKYAEQQVRDTFHRHCGVVAQRASCGPLPEGGTTTPPIAVAVSGGFASVALLLMAKTIRDENLARPGKAKITYNFCVVFLTDECFYPTAPTAGVPNNGVQRLGLVRQLCHDFGFPLHVASLADYVPDVYRQAVCNPAGDISDREELGDICLRRGLLNVAGSQAVGALTLLTGEHATRLAGRALLSVVRGRGSDMLQESAVGYDLPAGTGTTVVRHCRPMKALLAEECARYVALRSGVSHVVYSPRLVPMLPPLQPASLETAIMRFVQEIHTQFRSVSFNVNNAVAKLGAVDGVAQGPSNSRNTVLATPPVCCTVCFHPMPDAASQPELPLCRSCTQVWTKLAAPTTQPTTFGGAPASGH